MRHALARAALLVGLALAPAAPAEDEAPLAPEDFAHGRLLVTTGDAPLQTLLVDLPIYRGSIGLRLADVRVMNGAGEPLRGAVVELWHADANGTVHEDRFRTRLETDNDGRIKLSTVYPGYIWGPRHIHVVVQHPGHARLITRLFFKRDPQTARSGRPDLAVVLEDGEHEGAPALFGDVEIVLRQHPG